MLLIDLVEVSKAIETKQIICNSINIQIKKNSEVKAIEIVTNKYIKI